VLSTPVGPIRRQILTQEDWNIVLFNAMEKTSHWASLYFVALMTFGNYVLFNLLVAILVEGFSSEVSNNSRTALSLRYHILEKLSYYNNHLPQSGSSHRARGFTNVYNYKS
jgi:hypothetical protein